MTEVQSQPSDTFTEGTGTGQTVDTSTAVLVRMGLSANERAAFFSGHVISDSGEEREVRAIGYMVPEEGWVIHSSGGEIAKLNPLTVELKVAGSDGTVQWIGRLTATFTQNYAV